MQRKLTVSFDKPPKTDPNPSQPRERMSAAQINALITYNVYNVAALAGIGYVGKKLIDTTCEISLIAARAKLK